VGSYPSSMSDMAEISGQPCKTGCLPKPLIWRGVQRCSIILQLGFLLFGRVSPAVITDSPVAASDWNSFRHSIAPPRASLGQKATRVAEIVTRVIENFGTANGYLSQPRATSPSTRRNILHIIRTGTDWPLMAIWRSSKSAARAMGFAEAKRVFPDLSF
jgi:hypothetical protein